MPTTSVVQILTASHRAGDRHLRYRPCCCSASRNRYGRAIDRARLIMRELQSSDVSNADIRHLEEQLAAHASARAPAARCRMIYGSLSIFFVSLMILSLFAEQVFQLHIDFVALPFFAACLISLIVSIYYSIRDITVSLAALELEMSSVRPGDSGAAG